MADFTIKRGDTDPDLPFVCETFNEDTGQWEGVSLTSATTVVVQLRSGSSTPIQLTAVKDANQTTNPGKGTAAWTAGSTDVPGVYNGEIKVTWSNGKIRTFPNGHDPNPAFFTVEIEPDIPDP